MTTNLSGSLGTFSLDEVLAMLGMGGRTAHMEVTSPAGSGEIHVVDGHVSAASSDRGRATLLRHLVAAGDVGAADLARALEEPDAVRCLVDSGTVDRGFAHGVAVEQLVDALGEMLTWEDGEFAVRVGAEHGADIGVRVPVDEAVGRGRGRADEWGRVRSALPDEQTVLVLSPTVPEPPHLGADDWSVLVRIDGRRTLGEVVAAAGCAPLVASGRIVDLLGRGLVRVRTAGAEQPDEVSRMLDTHEGRTPGRDDAPEVMGVVADIPAAGSAQVAEPEVVPLAVAVHEAAAEPLADPEPNNDSDAALEPSLGPVPVAAALIEADPVEEVSVEAVSVEAVSVESEPAPVEREDPVHVEAEPAETERVQVESVVSAEVESAHVEALPVESTHVDSEHVEGVPVESEPVEADAWADAVPVLLEPEPEQAAEYAFPVAVEPVAWTGEAVEEDAPLGGAPSAGAGAVEWSPWAQALGLGAPAPEGELVVDPLAGPGIAEMIAEAHGLADTEHAPVPLAPMVDQPGADAHPVTVEAAADASLGVVPVPREPADDAWAAAPQASGPGLAPEPDGAGAATPGFAAGPAQEAADGVLEAAPAAEDPLAGGLLSHLMTGVRGL